LILARKIRARMKPLFLLDKSDCGSREQVRAAGFEFTRFDPALLIRASSFPVGLLIDTREKRGLQSLIRDLQCQSIPVISIHDLGLAPLPSDVVIDGSLQPGSPMSGPNGARHYMGPDYLVIEPDSSIRERAGPMPAAASKIVVGLGGGDTRFSFRRVLEALRRTRKELSILGIPGYSRWGQEELSREDWRPLQFQWADPDCSPTGLMSDADMAITAGGLMAFEALSVGVPLCALSHDRFQSITVQELCRAGACVNLGRGGSITPANAAALLRPVLVDRVLRDRLSRCGKRIVDGRGAERVATILSDAILPWRQGGPD